jgi:hypothetical protein
MRYNEMEESAMKKRSQQETFKTPVTGWGLYGLSAHPVNESIRSWVAQNSRRPMSLRARNSLAWYKFVTGAALTEAACAGDHHTVQKLLARGYGADTCPPGRGTALCEACYHGNVSMALLLISYGADPFLELDSQVPISLIEQLIKDGEEGFREVHDAVKEKYPDKYVEWWMAQGDET